MAQKVKRLPAMWETWVRSLGQEDPLEKEKATHSGTLAWKIPWMEKPGRLQSFTLSLRLRTIASWNIAAILPSRWFLGSLTVVLTSIGAPLYTWKSAHYSIFCAQRAPEICTIVIIIKELNSQVIHQLLHYYVVISYLYVSA